jgi:hypothetical protein
MSFFLQIARQSPLKVRFHLVLVSSSLLSLFAF